MCNSYSLFLAFAGLRWSRATREITPTHFTQFITPHRTRLHSPTSQRQELTVVGVLSYLGNRIVGKSHAMTLKLEAPSLFNHAHDKAPMETTDLNSEDNIER